MFSLAVGLPAMAAFFGREGNRRSSAVVYSLA